MVKYPQLENVGIWETDKEELPSVNAIDKGEIYTLT